MTRIKSLVAALAVLAALIVALPQSASAGFRHHHHHGWSGDRTVTHRVYPPRYRHRYYVYGDPYHYRYVKPRYYPAYNSHYWVPARCYKKCRKTYRYPRYYKAWGYPKRGHKHHRHHRRHHHHRHW